MSIASPKQRPLHAAQNKFAQRDKWALRRQRLLVSELVKNFDRYLGRAVRIAKPIDHAFQLPLNIRRRPVLTVLAPTADGRLLMAGAVAQWEPKTEEMRYRRIFQYDLGLPFARSASHSPPTALLLGKRPTVNLALQLLRALVEQEPEDVVWPTVQCDASGRLYEDFTPLYGLEVENPASKTDVQLVLPNPAARCLSACGIDAHEIYDLASVDFKELVALLKGELGAAAEVVPYDVLVSGIEDPDTPLQFSMPAAEAFAVFPTQTTQAVLEIASTRWGDAVCWADAEKAARNPETPLRVSRMSPPQVFWLSDMTFEQGYSGDILPDAGWRPQATFA